MRIKLFALLSAAAFGLAGCGETIMQQSLVGAGAGAGAAKLLNGDPLLGAVVGAAGNVTYCNRKPSAC